MGGMGGMVVLFSLWEDGELLGVSLIFWLEWFLGDLLYSSAGGKLSPVAASVFCQNRTVFCISSRLKAKRILCKDDSKACSKMEINVAGHRQSPIIQRGEIYTNEGSTVRGCR